MHKWIRHKQIVVFGMNLILWLAMLNPVAKAAEMTDKLPALKAGSWPGKQYQTIPTMGPSPTSASPTSAPSNTPPNPPQPTVTATQGGGYLLPTSPGGATASPTVEVVVPSPSSGPSATNNAPAKAVTPNQSSVPSVNGVQSGVTTTQVTGTEEQGEADAQTPATRDASGGMWQIYTLIGLGVLAIGEAIIIWWLRTRRKGKDGGNTR
jgi:cobalamin biosynthesis Mg chelatase CobN